MPADSLVNIARRACVRLSRTITDVGDCPYDLVRPILLKVESPEQLHQLEQKSPQIIGKDREVWVNLIKRDIPDWESKIMEPRDPSNWYRVYRKLKKDTERSMDAGEQALKAALDNIKTGKEQNLAQLTSRKPQLGPIRRPRASYGGGGGNYSSAPKGGQPTGFFDKIRKEAWQKKSVMTRPTHELKKWSRGVTTAPLRFVEDIKAKAQLPPPQRRANPAGTASSRGGPLSGSSTSSSTAVTRPAVQPYDMMQDREARLRALKNGKAAQSKPATSLATQQSHGARNNGLSEGFLEDEDNFFDDSGSKKSPDAGLSSASAHRNPGYLPRQQQPPRSLKRKADLFVPPAKKSRKLEAT